MIVLGQHTIADVRRRLFDHVQKLPLRFFDRYPVGPAGHAAHQRSREPGRDVLDGDRGAGGRSLRDGVLRLRDLHHRRAAGAGGDEHRAGAGGGRVRLPLQGARGVPRGAGQDRAPQRPPAGDHLGHEGGAAVRPRAAQPRRLRADERLAPRLLAQVDHLRLAALLVGRPRHQPDPRRHLLVRRAPAAARRSLARHHLRLHRLHGALLPPADGPLRQVLGDAVVDGERRARVPALRRGRGARVRRPAARASRRAARWCSTTCRSRTARSRSSRTSRSAWRPASGSRWWATPAPARPPC